ncbi:MAG TPA: hypothetical protein P5543_00745 [Planctomycetota bacterium]|nr:hypothetical protein [Planctomycetota bacterium]HRU50703.1 hypothetical protein [Planctomycetota bacterium]
MKKTLILSSLLCMLVMITGCLEMRQELRLYNDLSGEFHFCIVYDIDEFLPIAMALQEDQLKQQIKGQDIPFEINEDAVRNQIVQSMKKSSETKTKMKPIKLPDGVNMKLKFHSDLHKPYDEIIIKFKHYSLLQKIQSDNFNFKNLVFSKKGDNIIIEQKVDLGNLPMNQQLEQMSQNKNTAEQAKLSKAMMEKMLLKFRIRIPYKKYEVVKSSAHKIDGKKNTHYWDFSWDDFDKNKNTDIYLELAPKKSSPKSPKKPKRK